MALDTSKMLKLAEQCLERAQSTAAKLGGSPADFPRTFPHKSASLWNIGLHGAPCLCTSCRENTPEASHAHGCSWPLIYQPTSPGILG